RSHDGSERNQRRAPNVRAIAMAVGHRYSLLRFPASGTFVNRPAADLLHRRNHAWRQFQRKSVECSLDNGVLTLVPALLVLTMALVVVFLLFPEITRQRGGKILAF